MRSHCIQTKAEIDTNMPMARRHVEQGVLSHMQQTMRIAYLGNLQLGLALLQGSQANSWGLINPECFTPAHFQLELQELEMDELDGEEWLTEGPISGQQELGSLNTVHIQPRPPDTPGMTPAAGLHPMQQAIAILQNKGQMLDLPDHQWLDYVKSFLLPLPHFRAGFISTRIHVWQLYFHTFGETAKSAKILS